LLDFVALPLEKEEYDLLNRDHMRDNCVSCWL